MVEHVNQMKIVVVESKSYLFKCKSIQSTIMVPYKVDVRRNDTFFIKIV